MAAALGRSFAEQAFRDGIPVGAVLLKCRNWGVSGPRAAHVAEEAAAEAYRRALDRPFEGDAHFRAWVTRAALNVAVDILRREARARAVPLADRLAAPPSGGESDAALVEAGLARLPAEEREIVRLTFEEGLTLDEIADRVLPPGGGSANARRLRVKRKRDVALERLRGYLSGCDFSPDGCAGRLALS
jgi:RNA polymerase sigma factor (sigma-70 family)